MAGADLVDSGADFFEEDFTFEEGAEPRFVEVFVEGFVEVFVEGFVEVFVEGLGAFVEVFVEGLGAFGEMMDSPKKVISDKPFRKSAIDTTGLRK